MGPVQHAPPCIFSAWATHPDPHVMASLLCQHLVATESAADMQKEDERSQPLEGLRRAAVQLGWQDPPQSSPPADAAPTSQASPNIIFSFAWHQAGPAVLGGYLGFISVGKRSFDLLMDTCAADNCKF